MSRSGPDYSLGLAFGRVVQAQPLRHPARLNAVLADLLANDLTLRAPLRELVELPAFLKVEPLVGSATAVALVSFLLDELGSVYRDETLARLRTVLCGYFALPEVAEAEPDDAPYVEEKREQEEQPNNYNQVDSRLDDVDRHKEILKRLLNRQLWNEADRETWQLLVASCGGGGQESFESIWRAAPCALLYDINRLWCGASHFRFGFSVQRALWDELVSLSNAANSSAPAGSPREPARIFAEFLQSPTSQSLGSVHSGPIDSAALPPGFYPRGGMHRVWGGHRGWQIAWDSSCLLSHFAEVHARLVDCGLVGVRLDAGTRQQLQALLQGASPASATPPEAECASVGKPAQAKESKARPSNPPMSRQTEYSATFLSIKTLSPHRVFVLLVSWLLLSMLLHSLAGPKVTKECSSWQVLTRGFCYIRQIHSGWSR